MFHDGLLRFVFVSLEWRRVLSRRALRKRARRFEKVLFAPHGTFRLQRVELAHEGVHLLRLVPREPAGDVLRHGSTIEVKRSRLQVFRPAVKR